MTEPMTMECQFVYAPGFIRYQHGEYKTVLFGHWAALYRAMVKMDGEAHASDEFWSFFEDPVYTLGLINKSAYLSPQVSTPARKGQTN